MVPAADRRLDVLTGLQDAQTGRGLCIRIEQRWSTSSTLHLIWRLVLDAAYPNITSHCI